MDKEKNELDVKRNDRIASVLKATLGAIPFLGLLAVEIVENVVPNQRVERIVSFVKVLASKIDPDVKAKVEARMLEEKSIDLMEDGFLQAARALSEERIEYIIRRIFTRYILLIRVNLCSPRFRRFSVQSGFPKHKTYPS